MKKSEILDNWVREYLKPIKTLNRRHTAYGLKHTAQRMLGFYVSEGELKESMERCGYRVEEVPNLGWMFNVSEKSVQCAADAERATAWIPRA